MPPRSTGLPQPIQLASIVGSVDRSRDFHRSFRPASSKVRARWERIGQVYRLLQSHEWSGEAIDRVRQGG
jgi:hypothetical protein